MELFSVVTLVSLVLSFVVITRWAWKVVNSVWVKPKRLEKRLREQGLKGNSYRLLFGDLKESSAMFREARSKPINLDDNIIPRVFPFTLKSIENYGM